jgi:hypothetical protein
MPKRLSVLLAMAALLFTGAAQAVLGGAEDSVQADQIRLHGVRHERRDWQMATHEIRLGDGSGIKQYVNAAGVVFAVSWRTRLKPDLAALLGAQSGAYAASLTAPSGIGAAKHRQSVRRADLVLHQFGRQNAFAGLAYVPSLVPAGVDADALR